MTGTKNLKGRRAFLFLISTLVLSTAAFVALKKTGISSSPSLGKVPTFSLVERSGRTLSTADLMGKIWIADFVFMNCGGSCPSMTLEMARLQKSLSAYPNIYLVSFSVDPQRDTPDALSEYADAYGASKEKWFFLTGDEKAIYDLVKTKFHLPIDQNGGVSDDPIIHSTYFVVVDGYGSIRGYYDSSDAERMLKLSEDVKRIAGKDN